MNQKPTINDMNCQYCVAWSILGISSVTNSTNVQTKMKDKRIQWTNSLLLFRLHFFVIRLLLSFLAPLFSPPLFALLPRFFPPLPPIISHIASLLSSPCVLLFSSHQPLLFSSSPPLLPPLLIIPFAPLGCQSVPFFTSFLPLFQLCFSLRHSLSSALK